MGVRPSTRQASAGGRTLLAGIGEFGSRAGWEYFPIAFVGRLPFAMMIVGVLTLVSSATGSIALGGVTAASAGIGTAVCGPFTGALADRHGQRRVLLAAAAISILADVLMLVAVFLGASAALLVVLSIAIGGSTPQVAPFSRARLAGLAGGPRAGGSLGRGGSLVMSYESIADEASFVAGPVLVGLLTALINPAAPLLGSIVLTLTAIVAFAVHRTGRRVPGSAPVTALPPSERAFAVLIRPGILTLMAGMLLVGGVFGTVLTAVTAFMRERGAVGETGLVYGAMSVGAIVFVVGVAALPQRFGLGLRWPVFVIVGIAGCIVLASASALPGLIAGLALSGCGIGAALVTLFSLGAVSAPTGRVTTVLTALQSTLVVGQALATAAGGLLVEGTSAAAGFVLATALAAALCVVGAIRYLMPGPTESR